MIFKIFGTLFFAVYAVEKFAAFPQYHIVIGIIAIIAGIALAIGK